PSRAPVRASGWSACSSRRRRSCWRACDPTGGPPFSPSGGHLSLLPTGEEPPDADEHDAADGEEKPVVERNLSGHVPHVVDPEQVVVDHALRQVEDPPAEQHLTQEGAARRQPPTPGG